MVKSNKQRPVQKTSLFRYASLWRSLDLIGNLGKISVRRFLWWLKLAIFASQSQLQKMDRSPRRVLWRSIPVLGFFLALLAISMGLPAIARTPVSALLAQRQRHADLVAEESNPSILLQQGQQYYQDGQFAEAAHLWERAAQLYQATGSLAQQAQALNYLSLAYQNLGETQPAQTAIDTSLNLLQQLGENHNSNAGLLGQAWNAKGKLQLTQGEAEAALDSWQQAQTYYDQAGDETGTSGVRINQAQAWQTLGQYRKATAILEQLNAQLQDQPDTLLKASSLRSLGVMLQTVGDVVRSKDILEQSWTISDQLDAPEETSATLLGLGNLAKDFQQYDVALDYYRQAAKLATRPLIQVQARLNELSLRMITESWNEAITLVSQVRSDLDHLPVSRSQIYAKVNFADRLMKLSESVPSAADQGDIAQFLATAVQDARSISDARAEAYALVQLGKLYEKNQNWHDAGQVTEQALFIAQRIDANEISARAAGQLGRLLQQQGNLKAAVLAYQDAFETLQSLRSDLVAIDTDVQFEFKESVEPIYRELVSLLLQPSASQADLQQARLVLEALQLAELDNFFGDACLTTQPIQIDAIDPHAAVFYPIILSDRLETILSLPDGSLHHYSTPLPLVQIEGTLQQFYSSLYPGYPNTDRLQLSQQIYDWLLRPAEDDLERNDIQTLVFVLDGFLRNLPMAALYDGDRYLVEKYGIALSPGLQLFPEGLEHEKLNALAVGLTEARQGFSALPGVKGEIDEIVGELDSQVLIDGAFTRSNFQAQIESQPFEIVHIATHGQFSSNPEETFLLTWDDRIGIKDFNQLFEDSRQGLSQPIELLVMSACQTAAGDKRATLGLAGFALRSGARSTIASLWSVNDQATADLMSEFYRQIAQQDNLVSKAEALRQAQLAVLHNPLHKHPYFWSAFVLVGNWL
jgi:CHAT domain-containing protein